MRGPYQQKGWTYQVLRNFRLHARILRTCRQLHIEGIQILYHDNVLKIDAYNTVAQLPMMFPFWAQLPPSLRRSIKNTILDIEFLEPFPDRVSDNPWVDKMLGNPWVAVNLNDLPEDLFESQNLTIDFHPTLRSSPMKDRESRLIQSHLETMKGYRYSTLRVTSNGKPIEQISGFADILLGGSAFEASSKESRTRSRSHGPLQTRDDENSELWVRS